MLKKLLAGLSAGILISVGGSVFLACENKTVGAVFFSVALICICIKGYSLYTGKIGFIPEKHGKEEFSVLLLGLLGNAVGTVACGYLIRYAIPKLSETAKTICSAKLEQSFGSALVRAIFCGILMYLAVSIYRDKQKTVGILFCVPVFILAGFEHSVADMFYFAADGRVSLRAFLYICTIILGNTVGGMLLPAINPTNKEKKEEK